MNQVRLIGAGMWRTGTVSLKAAIEQLTGQPCHHMTEVIQHPATAARWLQAVHTGRGDWTSLLEGYSATLDWPSMAFWKQLSEFYPDAKILLSTREPEDWWQSIKQTVLLSAPTKQTAHTPWEMLIVELFEKKFVGHNPTKQQAIDAYNQHNDEVRKSIASDRLVEWSLGDGWEPLCDALNLPVPQTEFPHLNTAADYRRKNHLE